MIPVDQEKPDGVRGDCFTACVASIFELTLAEVPYFNDDWPAALHAWLWPRGFYPITISYADEGFVPDGFYVLGGRSVRDTSHAVVAHGRRVVHDPHPSRAGLTVREDCTVFVPRDPAKAR